MLDFGIGKWVKMPKMPLARSNMGVCTLNDSIYCIGGWNGQVGIKQCHVFSPEGGIWTSIAPLNIGKVIFTVIYTVIFTVIYTVIINLHKSGYYTDFTVS